ncbi:type II toxin-antitoxin system RelE/ParE family toxin [Rhizobium brockwellii]|uniref:type II toxin-antitoxin system RelE/ParE family toxin n=1 Tax=Rhizobium brockwellii TaxID=3019932 RepID=UPI00293DF0A8|nr:type II toxin-antitoxin system RelE/ParE family toxin [Rhizobium brockwellii]MDV4159328.1 type II toxin-antitoxin system RelE/ParE family toxin [Rhizobium brockwellii]
MDYYVHVHELAQAELDLIYETIRDEAGISTARSYVGGLYDLIEGLVTFPARGTVRPGPMPGLRIIGYRRTASIAFIVEGDQVTILGVFRRGQNVTPQMLKKRL